MTAPVNHADPTSAYGGGTFGGIYVTDTAPESHPPADVHAGDQP